jgi:hypothetical protein
MISQKRQRSTIVAMKFIAKAVAAHELDEFLYRQLFGASRPFKA